MRNIVRIITETGLRVYKELMPMKLQMKRREALEKINRQAKDMPDKNLRFHDFSAVI